MIRWKFLKVAWLRGALQLLLLLSESYSPTSAQDDSSDVQPTEMFAIRKDQRMPWSQAHVSLPPRHPMYDQFVAKVVDLSPSISEELRDVNKTFVSADSPTSIRIRGLHAGHKYSISIVGRKGESSSLIKEETLVMDPKAPDFRSEHTEFIIRETNITLRTIKNESFLQDSFLIEYRQINPDQKFPVLQVSDITDQKNLEFYLGNLNPGRDYTVRVSSVKDGITSRPWISTLTTKPSSLSSLTVTQNSTACVDVAWTMSVDGGADFLLLEVLPINSPSSNISKLTVSASDASTSIGDSLVPGESYNLTATVQKGAQFSGPTTNSFQLRPLPPIDFRVRADLKRGKYKLLAELPTASKIEKCHATVVGEQLAKINSDADVEQTKSGHRICWFNFGLSPGERFDFTLSSVVNESSSQKLQKSIVLTPAFDMSAFGLTLQEANGGIELLWPQSDVFMSRVRDIWNKVVGPESTLHLRVTPFGAAAERARQFKTSPRSAEKVFVPSLVKGACYKVQVYTVTPTGIISDVQHDETIRMSSPPVNVTLEAVTRASATLKLSSDSWEEATATDCQVSVVVRDMHAQIVFDKRLPLSTTLVPLLQLNGLRPFHKYTVNTQIVCGSGGSLTECASSTRTMRQLSFSTRQDRPGPVQALQVESLNAYSAVFSWLPPSLPNGILTHYVVNVTHVNNSNETRTIDVGASTNRSDHTIQMIVDGLFGGESYKIGVRAVTEAGIGDDVSRVPLLEMPIMAPPRPKSGPSVVRESIGSDSIVVKFSSQMLSNKHGTIKQIAVIVSEVPRDGGASASEDDNSTFTWLQVQRFETWPSYIAKMEDMARRPSDDSSAFFEEIGMDHACTELSVEQICNGPLKPSTAYRFKVRLFTAPNLFTDSPYSAAVTTESVGRGVPFASLVAVFAVVSFVGLVASFFLCYINRTRKSRCSSSSTYASSGPSKEKESQWAALKMMMAERAADCLAKLGLEANATTVSDGVDAAGASHLAPTFGHHRRCRSLRERTGVEHRLERLPSGPMHRTPLYTVVSGVNTNKNRPVRIADFAEHFRLMSADSDFRFSEEYEMMKNVGCGQSQHAAELLINRSKNRFTNILPYDHSRVRLSNPREIEAADYINANFIPGFSSRHEFIAAQGPLPTTRDAFWQMTWEQQCPAIIALTKCVEKGRDKCHQYWPDAENTTVGYGEIEVTMISEKHYDEFVVRELRLLKRVGGEVKSRVVRHWHYMAWPDFGVPQHPEGIILFAQLFRQSLPHSAHNMPTIVHCSAGVGRSGTFMAIDRLLHSIELDRPIDVFGIVYEMRQERCQMVQNEQQYVFIHSCVLHYLQSSPEAVFPPQAHQNPAFLDDSSIAESGF
ncbi:unnamed protein product [Caenorhabditis auriculariae]|uniref:protein-tyrosine-phosphatase n=1 Tax=Caenorhabditis auriculariae TaxID=2777116 RepID=A0A8S1H7T7_9PELO|nr:unnamed protein product [Caenorhabditis auriculariae]